MLHPSGYTNWDGTSEEYDSWCALEDVQVICIGVADAICVERQRIICSSFNAG